MTTETQEHTTSVWKRLQENATANAPIFQEAGIVTEQIAAITCRVCGTIDKALFWKETERRSYFLRLQCPFCQRWQVWYSVPENRIVSPTARRVKFFMIGIVATLILVAGSLTLFQVVRGQGPARILAFVDALAERITGRPSSLVAEAVSRTRSAPDRTWADVTGAAASSSSGAGASSQARPGTAPAAAAGAPATLYTFVAAGNRSDEATRLVSDLGIGPSGEQQQAFDVRYDARQNRTILVVDSALVTVALRARLGSAGWLLVQ